jgi:hypothetical protein
MIAAIMSSSRRSCPPRAALPNRKHSAQQHMLKHFFKKRRKKRRKKKEKKKRRNNNIYRSGIRTHDLCVCSLSESSAEPSTVYVGEVDHHLGHWGESQFDLSEFLVQIGLPTDYIT